MGDYVCCILKESIVAGICVLILGLFIRYLVTINNSMSTDFITKTKGMWLSLFLTGFFFHALTVLSGMQKWYCKACGGQ